MSKGKILVVDDEPVIRALIARVGEKSGYEVASAADAESGLEMLAKDEYTVVISDIRMPGKNGIWLLKEIKKKYPDTPIIMQTASDDLKDAIESLNLGAENYLLKPLSVEELVHYVGRAVEKRDLIRRDREHQQWLKLKLTEQEKKVRTLFLGSIKALAMSLEAKDEYTQGHSERVAELSSALARRIGQDAVQEEKIRIAGSLHDIGKIGVRESVLNKPGKLTPDEYAHIKTHPVISEHIVSSVLENGVMVQSIKYHHERLDGKGYPDGLKGGEIPQGARIIALADAYDAFTSNRPYRRAFPREQAIELLKKEAGPHLDPELVREFLKILEERK